MDNDIDEDRRRKSASFQEGLQGLLVRSSEHWPEEALDRREGAGEESPFGVNLPWTPSPSVPEI